MESPDLITVVYIGFGCKNHFKTWQGTVGKDVLAHRADETSLLIHHSSLVHWESPKQPQGFQTKAHV